MSFLGGCSVQSLWMVVAALFYAFYAVFVKYSGFEGIGSWEILFFRSIFGVVLFTALCVSVELRFPQLILGSI